MVVVAKLAVFVVGASAADPPLLEHVWTAQDPTVAELGAGLAAAGDLNGDGFADLAIGAPGEYAAEHRGAVFVYHGSPSGLSLVPDWTGRADALNSRYGAAVASAGDVDGDGYDDLLVGSPRASPCGEVYLYRGSAKGLETAPAWSASAVSSQGCPGFGAALAGVGDVDLDGYDDVVIGFPEYTNGESDEGAAFLYRGSAAGLEAAPSWSFEPNLQNHNYGVAFGSSVAPAGDVDGDGHPDVLVAAIGQWEYRGAVYLFRGAPEGLDGAPAVVFDTAEPAAQFGVSIAGAGDPDGDGYDDIVIGQLGYWDVGCGAFLYRGGPSGPVATPSWRSFGAADGSGFSVAMVGDVAGDGYDDLIVSAPYTSDDPRTGRIDVFLGGPSGPTPSPVWSGSGDVDHLDFGMRVVALGDVDGDGTPEVAVAADEAVLVYRSGLGCGDDDSDADGVGDRCDVCPDAVDALYDVDGDGVCGLAAGAPADCDDQDPAVYPGAPERCNGVSDACAPEVPADERDVDGDGALACADCDDEDPTSAPGLGEACGDGFDNNCDGQADEGCPEAPPPVAVEPRCGCASGLEGGWLGLVAGLFARRRARRRLLRSSG